MNHCVLENKTQRQVPLIARREYGRKVPQRFGFCFMLSRYIEIKFNMLLADNINSIFEIVFRSNSRTNIFLLPFNTEIEFGKLTKKKKKKLEKNSP